MSVCFVWPLVGVRSCFFRCDARHSSPCVTSWLDEVRDKCESDPSSYQGRAGSVTTKSLAGGLAEEDRCSRIIQAGMARWEMKVTV